MRSGISEYVWAHWRDRTIWSKGLRPLSWGFRAVAYCRRVLYEQMSQRRALPVPVIVVGNLTVGGTGKTPCVIWLANFLQSQGWVPGIITRGYKGRVPRGQTMRVDPKASCASIVGDEAILLARRTRCPVMVGARRREAARILCQRFPEVNLIISDDGLQHYALPRTLEIVMMDSERRWGNGLCLPAGPLREPLSRLRTVDLIISRGSLVEGAHGCMETRLGEWLSSVSGDTRIARSSLEGKTVHAVAGIGDPEKFFTALERVGIRVIRHAFVDHHRYTPQDLVFYEDFPIVMTEKDAVKCERFSLQNAWYVPLEVSVSAVCQQYIMARLTDG